MSSPSVTCKTLDTPPSSDLETSPRLPPSPPQSPKPKSAARSPVDRVLGLLHLHRRGRLVDQPTTADWRVFHLSRAQFAELEARIAVEDSLCGWWEDKVHYDWEPAERESAKGRLILRMPSAVHERFTSSVEKAVADGVADLAERLEKRGSRQGDEAKDTAAELRKITLGASTTLDLHPPPLENSSQETAASGAEAAVVRRSPDASFYHPHSDMPGTVLETSYSQQRKDLPRLAESYIIDSRHRVNCVVGLDIPYAGTRKRSDRSATVSVWRTGVEKAENGEEVGVCREDVLNLPFRDAGGNACDGALELHVSDFLASALDSSIATEENLSIPFSALASFLTAAEAKPPLIAPSAPRPTKFRKRKRSPEEVLDEERERKYLAQEEAELVRDRRVDGEWRSTARRRVVEGSEEVQSLHDTDLERRRSSRRLSERRREGG